MKKILALFVCFVILFTAYGSNIYAAVSDDTIQPYYTHICYINAQLIISGGKASYSITVNGYSTVTRTAITAYLQYRDAGSSDSWTTCDTAYGAGGQNYTFSNSVSNISSDYEYRVKAVVTAITSSYPESVTVYSNTAP